MRVFINYELNDGVTKGQYREWSRTVDQPMASKAAGRTELRDLRDRGHRRRRALSATLVEVIDAESWEAWQAVNDRPEMKEAVEQFFQIAKRGTVKVVYGEKVEP